MNILYVVKTFSVVEPMGILQLSACTNASGHKSFSASIDDSDVLNEVKRNEIDLVAFSVMSTEVKAFGTLAGQIKKTLPEIPIIAGGPHPTYFPQIADSWPIDGVVIGEGDEVICDIANALSEGKSISSLLNVFTKNNRNPLRPLVNDLDGLPYSDRNLVHNKLPFKYTRIKTFFATRGCPFNCSYCFNNAYHGLYRNNGNMLRRRSVDNLISEIKIVINNYPVDFLRFGDDAFIVQHNEWVEEFADKYSKEINIPFYMLINPNYVAVPLVKLLKNSGCHSVMMGIETGNEQLRYKVLKRAVSNESLLNAFKIFNDFGIKIFSNTILGLPSDDPDSMLKYDLESLQFTLNCKPYYSGFSVFTPFPGTRLHQYSKELGLLEEGKNFEDSFPTSMQQDSCLKSVSEKQKMIHRNILTLAPIANSVGFLRNLITNHLIYWRTNFVFSSIGFVVRNYQNMRVWPFKKSWIGFMLIFFRVLKIDKKNYDY